MRQSKKKSAYLPFVIISFSLLSCEEKLNEAKYTVQFKNTITHPTHFFNIVLLTDTTYLIDIISTQSKLECIAHNRMPRVLQKNSVQDIFCRINALKVLGFFFMLWMLPFTLGDQHFRWRFMALSNNFDEGSIA